ncbi:MAG: TonB-dependent siderophore receptor, partial [Burkholderiales bacterium PBB5]
QDLAYASWGQGVETEVVPNKPGSYSNAGQPLPALKSHQTELGFKHRDTQLDWTLAAFDIVRPMSADVAGARAIDGSARHTGVEAEAEWRSGPLSLRGSALLLRARREGASDTSLNGKRPTNVPAQSVKLQAAYNVAAVPGLAVLGFISHEGQREVLPDNSIATPGWTRLDIAARLTQKVSGSTVVWRLGIDNLANQRAWKEAPYQYDHAYLYPLAPRTVSASARINF